MDVSSVKDLGQRLAEEVGRAVIGMQREIKTSLVAVLAGGHCLMEGPPGVAKTLLVRALATALGARYARVQFTPDLMPSDVTGTSVFRPTEGRFVFRPGPIFADFLLCDEINRAPAKTQAALLEAMQEGSVTVDGESHALPRDFTVFATQNPIEHEGTYPLPEAQLDRFLFKVRVGYPEAEVEASLLAAAHVRAPFSTPADLGVQAVTSPVELLELRTLVRAIEVRPELVAYVVRLLRATRSERALVLGASPRAGVLILQGAKAFAALEGRAFVTPDDVKGVALPALRHRVGLDPAEEIRGASIDDLLRRLLDTVEVPR